MVQASWTLLFHKHFLNPHPDSTGRGEGPRALFSLEPQILGHPFLQSPAPPQPGTSFLFQKRRTCSYIMLLFPLSGSYASMCSGPHQGLALEIQRSIFNQILGASLPHHETQMHTHLPWNILATKNEPESNQASIKRPRTDKETSKCSWEEANRQVQNVGHSLGPLIWVVQQIKGEEIRRRTMRAALDEKPLQSHNHQMAGGGLVWTLICTNQQQKDTLETGKGNSIIAWFYWLDEAPSLLPKSWSPFCKVK